MAGDKSSSSSATKNSILTVSRRHLAHLLTISRYVEVHKTIAKSFNFKIAKTTSRKFETYPIVVRPNEGADINEEIFKSDLASKSGNYKKVYNSRFDVELKKAFREIVADLE